MLAIVILAYLSVLIVVMAVMLNYPRLPRQAMVNDFADELEAQKLLVSTSFRVDRAFRVGELGEARTALLPRARKTAASFIFPATTFMTMSPSMALRGTFPAPNSPCGATPKSATLSILICGGLVIEPEVEAPPYTVRDFEERGVPEDGEILHGVSFDQLRHERTGSQSSLF